MESHIRIQIGIKMMSIHNTVPNNDALSLSFTISTERSARDFERYFYLQTPLWIRDDIFQIWIRSSLIRSYGMSVIRVADPNQVLFYSWIRDRVFSGYRTGSPTHISDSLVTFFGGKKAVLWIRDSLVRISAPQTYGSFLLFSSVVDNMPIKNSFFTNFFCLLFFLRCIYISFHR
jgi:hypothetical protein